MKDLIDYRHLIMGSMEDTTLADAVAKWAEQNAGRRMTVNLVPDGFRLFKQYGSTYLVAIVPPGFRGERYTYEFKIAKTEKNVVVPTVEELRDMNGGKYEGPEKRNQWRTDLLSAPEHMTQEFLVFQEMEAAVKAYREAVRIFNETFNRDGDGFPGDSHPLYYQLRKLAGVIEER